MTSLAALWAISLAISAAALAIMIGLILIRFVAERRARGRDAERRALIPVLLGPTDSGVNPDASPDLLADLSVELIQLVRGDDRDDFIANASRLGVPAILRERLDSNSPRTRLAAAEALAEFPDEVSQNRLHAALADRNADVRLAAALALAAGGRPPDASELVTLLGIGDAETSLLVISLFRDIAAERPAEIEQLVLDPGLSDNVKAAAVEALASTGNFSLVPVIARLAAEDHDDPEAQPRYLRALGALGHPGGRETVLRGLANRHWQVRAAAAEAAGRIGMSERADDLVALLDDAHWWVRYRAGEALIALGPPGREVLGRASREGSPMAREAAALMLAETRTER